MQKSSIAHVDVFALEHCSASGPRISILWRTGIPMIEKQLPSTVQFLRMVCNYTWGECFHIWTRYLEDRER